MEGSTESKVKHFAMLFVVMVGAVIAGSWIWQQVNAPSVAPPPSTPTTSTA